MANSESIQNHCRFKIAEAREEIFKLSENTWAVYSVGTITTNEVCPAAAMQIQSGDTILIKPGCYVRTMDHVISADESEMIEAKIKTMDWAGEITDLFHYRNKDAIHQAVLGLWTRYNREFDATILLDQLDHLKAPDAHWAFTSPVAMIGADICLFAIGACLWKCCCRTKEDPPPQPSAPPMPMPAMTTQPATASRTAPTLVPKNIDRATRGNNAIPINITITLEASGHIQERTLKNRRDIGDDIFVNSVNLV
jgi:hypothetical protein